MSTHKFVDEIFLRVKAGRGGAGEISFLHEKFVEYGGPDGGDGGDGGDIIFEPSPQLLALSHLHNDRTYKAENGRPGEGANCNGKKGRDLVIRVPYGTQIINPTSGAVLHDFIDAQPFIASRGGRGGKGNSFFKTSRRQAPHFAQPGEDVDEIELLLALKMIADIGLVGFPNAGKSTLLKALTQANPKIANYPFTTLSPNIGVIEEMPTQGLLTLGNSGKPLIVADIPGILEGASKGYGLGLSFLKHIERVRMIVYVIDLENAYVEDEFKILQTELNSYSPELLKKPAILVLNKIDLIDDPKFLKALLASYKKLNLKPIPISAQKNLGMDSLLKEIARLLKVKPSKHSAKKKTKKPEKKKATTPKVVKRPLRSSRTLSSKKSSKK